MIKAWCLILAVATLLLSGCAGMGKKEATDQPLEKIVYEPSAADAILSCMSDTQKMSRKDFKKAYTAGVADAASGEETALQRLICLSLHQYAGYKQFKDGMETLALYIKEHPENGAALRGVQMLLQRLEREKISKWSQSTKSMDEKEGLEAENRELLERNEQLEKNLGQEQTRINELKKQIEQLKNIENIIKNRER